MTIASELNLEIISILKIEHAEPRDQWYTNETSDYLMMDEEIIPITRQGDATFFGFEPNAIELTDFVKITYLVEKIDRP